MKKKGEREREGECHARKASTASDFYSRGHAVASLKIKTFHGEKLRKHAEGESERGESSFMSARPCSRFAENKRRQTPFRVAAAFISPPPALRHPFASPPPSFIRPSVRPSVRRKGRNFYHVFLSGLRYEKEYRALSPWHDIQSTFNCCRMERPVEVSN